MCKTCPTPALFDKGFEIENANPDYDAFADNDIDTLTPGVATMPEPRTVRTLENNRSGDTIETTLTNEEAASKFAELAGDDSWLWFWVHKFVNETEAAPKVKNAVAVIFAMFVYAIGAGLKRPRMHVVYQDVRYYFYLSRRGTLCIKAGDRRNPGENTWEERQYIGCIYDGRLIDKGFEARHHEFFDALTNTDDVAAFLAELSKAANMCSYCGAELSDETSKALGYGKTCAKHWGLAWGKKVVDQQDQTPSFARMAGGENVQGLVADIIEAPGENANWEILADLCEENGLPRTCRPEQRTIIPGKGSDWVPSEVVW